MEIKQEEIKKIEDEISPLIATAESCVVDSVEAVDNASLFLKEIKDKEKRIEEKRQEITKPLNESLRAVNDLFKKLVAPLVKARATVTEKILSWRREEQKRIDEENARLAKLQEEQRKKGIEVTEPVKVEKVENKIGNVQAVKRWTFEITDFAKVPDRYKIINTTEINQAIKEGKRGEDIPGVRIFQDEKISIVGR